VKLGAENRNTVIIAAVLGAIALFTIVYEFMPASETNASTATSKPLSSAPGSILSRSSGHHGAANSGKKEKVPQSLDPTLQLQQLAVIEQIKYEGTGRNIFVSQAEDVAIPKPLAPGTTGPNDGKLYQPPAAAPAPPIPLKFFGFASQPGERKRIFLSKGEDVFIAGEGDVVDRRYKVIRISTTSVDIQDVVGSGPPQSIPLTQG
jgi:hypothetical protein